MTENVESELPVEENSAILDETLTSTESSDSRSVLANTVVPKLAIIWHSDPERIGETARLHVDRKNRVQISRTEPAFYGEPRNEAAPLLDRHLSRSPMLAERLSERQFRFETTKNSVVVRVNGRELTEPTVFDMDELGAEIIILLSNSVVLSLFNAPLRKPLGRGAKDYGLLGISEAITATRRAIERLSASSLPILIRGETGTGKELVATGLHQSSDRKHHCMIPVNMATLTPSLAAAELFGAKKGSFTGADNDHIGLFEKADRGVLFLDEIGDTPKAVQPMLLRVIETGESRRVGDNRVRHADVRIIAATDRQLGETGGERAFNQPLLRRLEAATINIPPLRERRSDLGVLLRHFLLEDRDALPRFDPGNLTASDVNRLALYRWPGNVRELRNLAQQLRLGHHTSIPVQGQDASATNLADKLATRTIRYDDPSTVSEARLLKALDECNWVIKATAQHLNISRTSLYELMRKSPAVRKIGEISDSELRSTVKSVAGGYDQWARHLKVGREALRKRLKSLQLGQ